MYAHTHIHTYMAGEEARGTDNGNDNNKATTTTTTTKHNSNTDSRFIGRGCVLDSVGS